jgi:hypothetical protein
MCRYIPRPRARVRPPPENTFSHLPKVKFPTSVSPTPRFAHPGKLFFRTKAIFALPRIVVVLINFKQCALVCSLFAAAAATVGI